MRRSNQLENDDIKKFVDVMQRNNNSSSTKDGDIFMPDLLNENALSAKKLLKSDDVAELLRKLDRCIPSDHCMIEKSCENDSIMMCRCSRKDWASFGKQPRLKEINGSTSKTCLFNPKDGPIFNNSTFLNMDYTFPTSIVTIKTYQSILMTSSWLLPTILSGLFFLFLMTSFAIWLRIVRRKRDTFYQMGEELPSPPRLNINSEILRSTPQHMVINAEYSPFIEGSFDYSNNNVAQVDAAVVYEMPVIVNSTSDSDEQPSNCQNAYHSFRHLVVSHERVEFMTQIGEGAFGTVHKASLWDAEFKSKRLVAVKTVKDAASDLLKETELMTSFHHPNILTVIGLVVADVEMASSPSIIMEYMKYGDLATVLRSNKPGLGVPLIIPVTQRDLLNIGLQVCRGMTYLASKRFVHRDLACRNCLVGENLLIKVSDFGMSRDVYSTEYYMIRGKNRILPIRWMAPESLDFGHFSEQSDVWGFAVVLWEIFTYGSTPYNIFCNKEVSEKVIRNEIRLERPENCSEELWEQVLSPCWQTRENRPRFTELLTLLESFDSPHDVTSETTYAIIEHD